MSVAGEVNADIYRQMMELQNKLKQSEAERMRLEEMFSVLIKTFKEEECVHLKSLESRYHSFLEDCARRSNRNEKILRSLERVESGANVLYAKTERLRLLRNYYEAYLERVIPTWKQQPSPLRFGLGQVASEQEMGRRQLAPEESVESSRITDSRIGKYDDSNCLEYLTSIHSDNEQLNAPILSSKGNHRKYVFQPSRDFYVRGRFTDCYDRDRDDYGFKAAESRNDIHTGPLHSRLEEEVTDNVNSTRGLESAFYSKFGVERGWDLVKQIYKSLREEENSEQSRRSLPGKFPVNRQSKLNGVCRKGDEEISGSATDRRRENFSDGIEILEEEDISDRPIITREPVEIKKPEYIVGRLHPEATSKFEYFNKYLNSKELSYENVKEDTSARIDFPVNEGKFQELENVRKELEMEHSKSLAKWSLLKHKNSIDKLKETISFEEDASTEDFKKPENKPVENVDALSVSQPSFPSVHEQTTAEDTDVSQILSGGWKVTDVEIIPQTPDLQTNFGSDKDSVLINSLDKMKIAEGNEYEETHEEISKKEVCESNDGDFEDNEEAYPESYYEQPAKSNYSRNIVSNVILEEDESEVNVSDYVLKPTDEISHREDEKIGGENEEVHCEAVPTQSIKIHDEYNLDNSGFSQEKKAKEDEFQSFEPTDQSAAYNEGDMYGKDSDYNNIQPQEEYLYQNQGMNNYSSNLEFEGNADTEQYQVLSSHQDQHYRAEENEELGNYAPDDPNYQNNPELEHYNNSGVAYQYEYNQAELLPEDKYYNHGASDADYYHRGNELPGEHQNLDLSGATGFQQDKGESPVYDYSNDNLPLRQSNLAHLLESDSESFQMEHGPAVANEDSDFDFSMGPQQ